MGHSIKTECSVHMNSAEFTVEHDIVSIYSPLVATTDSVAEGYQQYTFDIGLVNVQSDDLQIL